ncbi:hypothetical protein LOK49_LG13G02716 [Camellia lanceoleosa]|uniref:Uncharacterized protein n=1 Tax=Camellia lanceoleosa TaxID=1840588 RepID=A0ACC0FJS1_9ERIC|nr:hypothetical protein LOK49_LG13G02716 [Camellia lanceoleosa]
MIFSVIFFFLEEKIVLPALTHKSSESCEFKSSSLTDNELTSTHKFKICSLQPSISLIQDLVEFKGV